MTAVVIHASQFTQGGPARTGGRYCGYVWPSSGQRLAHHKHAECGRSPARSSGRFFLPRMRGGGDRRTEPGHRPVPDFSRLTKAADAVEARRLKIEESHEADTGVASIGARDSGASGVKAKKETMR